MCLFSAKRYLELVRAINGLTQDLNIGSTDESNGVRNVERVRAEIKKMSEKTVKDKQVLETSLEKSGKVCFCGVRGVVLFCIYSSV